MPYKKGNVKKGGRIKGTPNKFTGTVKEAVFNAFKQLQEDPKTDLMAFAKKYPREFYTIAAKLIPSELVGVDGKDLLPNITIVVKDESTRQALLNIKK